MSWGRIVPLMDGLIERVGSYVVTWSTVGWAVTHGPSGTELVIMSCRSHARLGARAVSALGALDWAAEGDHRVAAARAYLLALAESAA